MKKQVSLALAILASCIVAYGSMPKMIRTPRKTMPVPQKTVVAPAPVEAEEELTPEEETTPSVIVPEEPPLTSARVAPIVTKKTVSEELPVMESDGDEMSIDISAANCAAVSKLLNVLLADEYVLTVKTKNFHWNIKNTMNFNDLHLFFDKQYNELNGFVDMVAERVRALGERSLGTMSEFIKSSRLQEEDGAVPTDKEMIKKLLDDHEAIIRAIRADIEKSAQLGDMGTNNLLCDLITKHEKMAWMLRSYIK